MAGPTGLSSSDVLRDLFTMPSRQWNEFQSTHWCLSLWDKLRDEHLRDVVLTYAAYAVIPLIAAEVAPWLMLPLALTGVGEAVAGLAVLGTAAGLAGGGTAWLNVENGEKWYQGLGLQVFAAVGELWARAGSAAEVEVRAQAAEALPEGPGAQIGAKTTGLRREGPGAMTARPSNVWPSTPEEMDDILGFEGVRVPDSPTTFGRGKVIWQPSDNVKITFEQHPYHVGSAAKHSGPHWHIGYPGVQHARFLPGDVVPWPW